MISLNLVEQSYLKNINRERTVGLLKNFIFILLIVVVFSSLSIFIAHKILVQNLADLQKQNSLILTQKQSLNQGIDKINKKLSAMETVQKEFQNRSEFIIKTSALIPPGIQLSEFSLSSKNNSLSLAGLALTRDDFLTFNKNLENSGLVENINSPLSNILSPQNITFSLSATIKK